jgi:hypothetical protein
MISVGGTPISIFGIIDLCVAKPHQMKGVASELLSQCWQKGRDAVEMVN